MKKKILTCLIVVMISLLAIPVSAEEVEISVEIDGIPMTFSYDQGYPVMVEGRTLVPLRAIFEALGATVKWNPEYQSIEATKGERYIYLVLNSTTASVYTNSYAGSTVELDVPATLFNGRTYVPLRFVSEAMGATVDYKYGKVSITTSTDSKTESSLSNLTNEIINEQYVDFSKYELVVAERYSGANSHILYGNEISSYDNIAYEENNNAYEIAFFGGAYGVEVITYSYMGAEPITSGNLGYHHNQLLIVNSSFPNDGSYDVIKFTDGAGRTHEIVVEDMSDDMGLILVEKRD